ncbi:hypothetical protein JCM10212_004624 [Sporobolomyces blumeae]
MSSLPYHVPRPSTPPARARPYTRASPPASLTLSPHSLYSYSETDAFLSPRSSPGFPLTPSEPGSPRPLSPSLFHPESQSSLLPLSSPSSNEKPSRDYFGKVATTAKRTRRTRAMLGAVGGIVAAVVGLGLLAMAGGSSRGQVAEYSNKIGTTLTSSKDVVQDRWTGPYANEATDDEPPTRPTTLEATDSTLFDEFALPNDVDDTGPIRINPMPRPRRPNGDRETRYLGFLPHSGYHNQRIALQNALLLGKLLNRTVLVPPIWIGWPISTEPYDDLAKSWVDIMLLNPASFNLSTIEPSSRLNEPASYSSTVESFPCPTCAADDPRQIADHVARVEKTRAKWHAMGYEMRPDGYPITALTAAECKSYSPECRHTYPDSFLSYEFLVDLQTARAEGGVEVVDRWDMRERAIEELLDVTEDDIFVIKDRQAYDFRITDQNMTADSPLISPNLDNSTHWNRDVSLPTLATLDHRVLLFGSLFGGGRVDSSEPDAGAWAETFARAMAFENEWLLRPAEAIVDRLGGQANFVGVHARVGDGEFLRHGKQNMELAWKELSRQLGVDEGVMDEMWDKVKPGEQAIVGRASSKSKRHGELAAKQVGKRAVDETVESTWTLVDEISRDESAPPARRSEVKHRSKRGIFDDDAWSFLRGPTQELSALLRNLTCRSRLHSDSRLKAFNTPLYLATDSRSPTIDPNLRPFFDAFPCTFILSDFDRADPAINDGIVVGSVGEMSRLVNELDSVELGRLFLPFLEAVVAAKARITVGTPHSTFSGFAAGSLHDAYWE